MFLLRDNNLHLKGLTTAASTTRTATRNRRRHSQRSSHGTLVSLFTFLLTARNGTWIEAHA